MHARGPCAGTAAQRSCEQRGQELPLSSTTHACRFLAAARIGLALALAAQAVVFRSADAHNPDDDPTVAAVSEMGKLLEKQSGWQLGIKVYNKGALGIEKETIDQLKLDALDMKRVNVGPMNAICPLTQVPAMPFLFRSTEHLRKVLDGPVGDEILKRCEPMGFIGLAFDDVGGTGQRDARERHAHA